MSQNEQKTPLARSINQAAVNRVEDFIQIAGKSLPCTVISVQFPSVTVAFAVTSSFTLPHLTVPVMGSEYVRIPIVEGCKGVVFPADVPLGGLTGLGSGSPSLTAPPNLTGLVFFPISATSFQATNPAMLTLYGEPGVMVQTKTDDCSISLDNGVVTITASTLNLNATVMINGKAYAAHDHSGVEQGYGISGPVASP